MFYMKNKVLFAYIHIQFNAVIQTLKELVWCKLQYVIWFEMGMNIQLQIFYIKVFITLPRWASSEFFVFSYATLSDYSIEFIQVDERDFIF